MVTPQEVLFRLAIALLVGGAIGVERQWHQKMAGLRTNVLVALGACGFVIFTHLATPPGTPINLVIPAQVVSGIGFLGAGVILREGINVHGLNTAATLWCSAMAGVLAGGGFWAPCLIAAAFVVLTNLGLRPIVRRLNERVLRLTAIETHYVVELTCKGAEEAHVRALLLHALEATGLSVRQMDSEDVPGSTDVSVTARAVTEKRDDTAVERIVGRLTGEPYILAATWTVERAIPES